MFEDNHNSHHIFEGNKDKKEHYIYIHNSLLTDSDFPGQKSDQSMFRNHEDHGHNFFSLSSSSSSPQDLNCTVHVAEISQFLTTRTTPFSGLHRADELHPDDDVSDDGCQLLGEKKKRLNLEQVRALEESFSSGNKLGPERKMELSRALGLNPRQITIWFQNRRARWKTKQLEKDYEVLRRKIESIKADNDDLKSQNKELQSQLLALERIESSCGINLNKDSYKGSWNINGSCKNQSNLNVFPDSVNLESPAAYNITQLLHSSSGPDSVIPGHRIDNPMGPASAEPVYNIFMTGIQENRDAWPWQLQQNHFR